MNASDFGGKITACCGGRWALSGDVCGAGRWRERPHACWRHSIGVAGMRPFDAWALTQRGSVCCNAIRLRAVTQI